MNFVGQVIVDALAFLNANSGAFVVLLIFVLVLINWQYMRVTTTLIKDGRRIREFETEPSITLYSQYEKDQSGQLKDTSLIIKNIGKGYARNIELAFPKEIKKLIIHDYNRINPNQKFVKIISSPGIPQIAPGDSVKVPMKGLVQLIRQKVGEERRFLPVSVKYQSVDGKNLSNVHYMELYPRDL